MRHSRRYGLLCVLLAVALASGCRQVQVRPTPRTAEQMAQMHKAFDGRTVTVTPRPGAALAPQRPGARPLRMWGTARIEGDQVRLSRMKQEVSLPVGDIQELDANRSAGMALLGALIGLGAFVGMAIALPDREPSSIGDLTATDSGRIFVFAPLGLMFGAVAGAAAGYGPTWRFD